VADILEFPQVGGRRARASSGLADTLRDSVNRLGDATMALRRSRDDLMGQHDALDSVKGQLMAQVAHSRTIAALARAIEDAIAVGDDAAIGVLQAELKVMLDGHAARRADATLLLTDAAD
jgi:hypothetical protein